MIVSVMVVFLFGITGEPESRESHSDEHDRLQPIAWLVGGTWTAQATAPDGSLEISEVTYRWAKHGKAIQYSLVRKSHGKVVPALEGICGWHPGKKKLVLWEMDNDGNLTEGELIVTGKVQRHEEVIYGADGSELPVRAEVIRESDDLFAFEASVERNGEWTVVFARTYRRGTD